MDTKAGVTYAKDGTTVIDVTTEQMVDLPFGIGDIPVLIPDEKEDDPMMCRVSDEMDHPSDCPFLHHPPLTKTYTPVWDTKESILKSDTTENTLSEKENQMYRKFMDVEKSGLIEEKLALVKKILKLKKKEKEAIERLKLKASEGDVNPFDNMSRREFHLMGGTF